MPDQKAVDTVLVRVYPETRRRINIHSAVHGMKQPDYIDSVVPPAGDGNDARE